MTITVANTYKSLAPQGWRAFEVFLNTRFRSGAGCTGRKCCICYGDSSRKYSSALGHATIFLCKNHDIESMIIANKHIRDRSDDVALVMRTTFDIDLSTLPYFRNVSYSHNQSALIREVLYGLPRELVQWTLALWFQSELERVYPQINRVI